MKRMKLLNMSALVFILLYAVFAFGATIEYQRAAADEKEKLEDDLLVVKTNIEQMITARMINAKGLAGVLQITDDFSDVSYDLFAEGIYESSNNIVKDVVLITDTTISHVYPNYYDQGAIGIDLAQIPEQRDVLLYTKETGNPVFIGPVDLVEGGKGIIVRVPVVVSDSYYGQIAIVFDYFNFIEGSGLKDMVDGNYVALIGRDPITRDEFHIWYNNRDTNEYAIDQTINLEGVRWTIRVTPANGWQGDSILFYGILIFGALVSLSTTVVFYRRLVLKEELVIANTSLMSSVKDLKESKKELESHLIEIQEKEAYIQYQADHDNLTKLCNRRVFTERIKKAIELGNKGTVVLLDLDNFKNINDSHGHIHGDKLLKQCAAIINESVGSRGTAFRFGGDEFLILFEEDVSNESIEAYLSGIGEGFENLRIDEVLNHVTMSAGIVHFPENGNDVEDLLIKSDVAMYSAKYRGKNCFVYFKEELLSDFDIRLSIEGTIREAIKNNGFTMLYQPIIEMTTGDVVGFEALVRLADFKYGPMTFIPVAEETGMIVPLGFWIIEDVVRQIRQWLDIGLDVKPVAINISPKQLVEKDFVARFFETLEAYEIDTSLIQVEITESILLENEEENIQALTTLHDAGIKISLDDFGTGYSSLNYLTFLPVDKVKLDKSLKDRFIRLENIKVLTGIVDMFHGLSLGVVAEGIENPEEWEQLREAGCDFLQGYLFSKPVQAIKASTLIGKCYGDNAKSS